MAGQNVTQLTQQTVAADPSSLLYAVTGGSVDTGLPLSVFVNNLGLTGVPTAPTATTGTNTTQIASTAFVQAQVAAGNYAVKSAANTFTASQTISVAGVSLLGINDSGGANQARVTLENAGASVWGLVNQSTSNTFTLSRYVAGVLTDTPISVANATGIVTMADGIVGPHNGSVGATTPSSGAFTTLSASGTVSGTGFSTYLASPPAIGGTAAAAGSFTTLSATSTVSGAGFTARFATPGPIGNTTASTGNFTTLGATGLITPSTTVGIKGTAAADNAQAGSIGEVISASVVSGSAVSLTTGTPANITSISLTAGDWDVWGQVVVVPAATSTLVNICGWVNTVTVAQPTYSNTAAAGTVLTLPFTTGASQVIQTGVARINVSSTTTVFLGTQAAFGVSTCAAYGYIQARRRR